MKNLKLYLCFSIFSSFIGVFASNNSLEINKWANLDHFKNSFRSKNLREAIENIDEDRFIEILKNIPDLPEDSKAYFLNIIKEQESKLDINLGNISKIALKSFLKIYSLGAVLAAYITVAQKVKIPLSLIDKNYDYTRHISIVKPDFFGSYKQILDESDMATKFNLVDFNVNSFYEEHVKMINAEIRNIFIKGLPYIGILALFNLTTSIFGTKYVIDEINNVHHIFIRKQLLKKLEGMKNMIISKQSHLI